MQGSRRVARNIGSTLITQAFSWAITFFMISFVARYVHSTGSGQLGVAAAYGAILSVLYGVVSGFVLVRDIARDHSKLPELVCAAIAIRIPIAIVTIVLGVAAAMLLNQPIAANMQMIELIGVCMVCVWMGQINDVLMCALKGVEEFPKVNAGMLAEKIAMNVAVVLFILLHKSIVWIQAGSLISGTVQLFINLRAIRPYWSGFVMPSKAAVVSLFTQSLPFISSVFFIALYNQADPLYIRALCSYQVAGWYGIPNKLIGSCIAIPVAVAGATLPTLSRLYHEDEDKFVKFVGQLVGLMYLAVIPFSAVMVFAPDAIIHVLRLPGDFDGTIPTIRIGGFTVAMWFLSQMTGTALIASDRQAILGKATGMAALVSIPSCISLVWLFQRFFANGAMGATLSDGVVEFMMLRSYVQALPRGAMRGWGLVRILGCICAAVPIVVPLYFFHSSKLSLLTAIPGLIAYLPLCILLRVVDKGEIMNIVSLLRSKASSDPMDMPAETLEAAGVTTPGLDISVGAAANPQISLEHERYDLIAEEENSVPKIEPVEAISEKPLQAEDAA